MGRRYSRYVLDECVSIRRSGKCVNDYLIQRGFIAFNDAAGRTSAALLARDARRLERKTAFNLYTAQVQFTPKLRTKGHTGFVVNHTGMDRGAGFDKQTRLVHMRTLVYYTAGEMEEDKRESLCRKEWDLVTSCTIHNANNGVKWGMEPHFDNRKADLKAIHIAFASVRQSADLVTAWTPELVERKLDVIDDKLYSDDAALTMWRAMGVTEKVAMEVTGIGLFATGSRLHVNPTLLAFPDWKQWLVARLMTIFSFSMFTESRFLSLGTCSRGMIAALAAGLGLLVEILVGEPTVHKHFIRGFRRLLRNHRRRVFGETLPLGVEPMDLHCACSHSSSLCKKGSAPMPMTIMARDSRP